MEKALKILIVEDSEDDTELLVQDLRRNGYVPDYCRVDTAEAMTEALALRTWDLIIADYTLPAFSGIDALRLLQESGNDLPFIIVSGTISEDQAVTAMKAGAHDCVSKGNSKRLIPAIERELSEATIRHEGKRVEQALQESERRFREILSNARFIAITLDMGWDITFCNNFLLELTDWQRHDVIGRNWCDLFIPPEFRELTKMTYLELINKDLVPLHSESEIMTRTGERRLILWDNTILWDLKGKVVGIASIGVDITARKKAEDELYRLNLRLEQRVKERTAQLETANHELAEYREKLEAELLKAAAIQTDLQPRTHPVIPGFELAARCLPAHEVGGDFYDWQQVESTSVTLTLGDVMGKGIPAALLMATVRAIIRTAAQQNPPAETLRIAAASLTDDLERSGSFVTLFHARLDAARRTLTYVDVGHGHVFLLRADGSVTELPHGGLPLGVIDDERYEQGDVTFAPGDALVLFSDGLIDARPEMALDHRKLADFLRGTNTAPGMVDRLISLPALDGPLPDDLTVLVLRCSG